MSEIKTRVNDASVEDFINSVDSESKRQDGFTLLKLYSRITGEKPKMWGTSIIGFGQYHYKSQKSSQEGDWMLAGFSPRKQSLSIYLMHGFETHVELLQKLGKHKTGMGCLYINRLSDVDMKVLEELIAASYERMKKENSPQ